MIVNIMYLGRFWYPRTGRTQEKSGTELELTLEIQNDAKRDRKKLNYIQE